VRTCEKKWRVVPWGPFAPDEPRERWAIQSSFLGLFWATERDMIDGGEGRLFVETWPTQEAARSHILNLWQVSFDRRASEEATELHRVVRKRNFKPRRIF
jgi:hypothetical protein